ncbi:MAG: sulfite exporter TauE/SafE family protein [archaeon]
MKNTFKINGMHCNSCERLIESELKDKVNRISVSYKKGTAEIDFDESKISVNEIKKIIGKSGYTIGDSSNKDHKSWFQKLSFGWMFLIFSFIFLFFVLYYALSGFNLEIPSIGEKTSLFLLFFVGILTGFHCVAMCGGFVVSYTTNNAIKGHKDFRQHIIYGGSKVFSYALIGGIFGLIGGIFAFSVLLRGGISIFAGLFMIFYALSMLGIGFFRKFQFNPKFLSKAASAASKEAKGPYKAPFITGLLSGFFIACGPLQAMYLYAAGTGSFFQGMTSLAAFGLGTLPVMIGFGSLTTVISHKTTKRILKLAAILVLFLGLVMLNRGLTVMGSPVSYDSIKANVVNVDAGETVLVDGKQEISMEVTRSGWSPDSFVLKKGVPVVWKIDVKELTGCNNEIIVRDYNLDIKLEKGMNIVEFTPDKEGTVRWSCWMGMIPGSFIVTADGAASEQELAAATPQGGGSCGGGSGGCGCGG